MRKKIRLDPESKYLEEYLFFENPYLYEFSHRQLVDAEEISEFVNWGRRNPVLFAEELFGVEMMDYQKYAFMNTWNAQFIVWLMSRNGGKALALDTPILKADGHYATMGDLTIGDYVVGDDGKPAKVISTSPIFYNHDCYEVEFSDGEKIIADADHLWSVYNKHDRHHKAGEIPLKDLTTKRLAKDYVRYRKDNGYPEYKYAVPLSAPVEAEQKDFVIPPYVLGYWLGDGTKRTGEVTCWKQEYKEIIEQLEIHGAKVFSIRNSNNENKIVTLHNQNDIPLITLIKQLGLYCNKHIPEEYFHGSVQQRLELVQGLMDSDGYVSDRSCSFSNSNKEIIDGFSRLLDSLGIRNVVTQKRAKYNGKIFDSYVVTFMSDKQFPVFCLPRKYNALPEVLSNRRTYKTIVSIKPVQSVPTKCICVDNNSHRYLCGYKNTVTHNSILGAIYLQTRSILVPNFTGYIIAGVGSQSIETFTKIENLTYKKIPSFTTLTDVFQGELVMSANSNGFVHSPSSHKFSLYDNSSVFTINGNIGGSRSKRSNCNFYDECVNMDDEQFRVTEPFLTQNAEFKLGVGQDNTDQLVEPSPFPNQAIYASSAGTKEQYLYHKYRECSLRMDAGDSRYFCLDLTADAILNATQHGVPLAKPLLTQEVIDARLREDKVAGMREYYNEFETEDLDKQIVSRATIIRNSAPRMPVLKNPDGKHKYIIAYDPARLADNSVVGIGDIYQDPQVGWKMRIVNFVSLADTLKKAKTPVNTPAQIKIIKHLLLDYNGTDDVADYENIKNFSIDAGSGGAGVPITDFLCEDWEGYDGHMHRGLIDNEYNEGDRKKYPNAVDKVMTLLSPKKYKSDMFESLIEMMDQNLVEFPEEYLDKGYINLIYEVYPDGKRVQRYTYPTEEEEEKLQKKGIEIVLSPVHLSKEEEIALKQIDLAKQELRCMYRYKQSGDKDRFDLAPDKANSMHDDRALNGHSARAA